jgi:hypothetical protein
MKSKKTIRHLPPQARDLINLQIELFKAKCHSRTIVIIQAAVLSEIELRSYENALDKCLIEREQAAIACRSESQATIKKEHEGDPPGGSAMRQNEGSDCRLDHLDRDCVCGD